MKKPLKKIPSNVMTFKEGENPQMDFHPDGLQFEAGKDEIVDVYRWVRFPSYDFIFGVPHKTNKKAELEVGYFLYRNAKTKRRWGFYLDCAELSELSESFERLVHFSRLVKGDLWQKHDQKNHSVTIPLPQKDSSKKE